ncbi:MAG: hypothetical protein M1819_001145 [Sarea resinae]|nr:MAG: hypothetical protein M1819_001145 [Sarea resinae]
MASDHDSDDSISVTSTAASEERDAYPVERILAEIEDENGDPFYLVKWEGYPNSRSTWEPRSSFADNDDETLPEWEARKQRIEEGLELPFDIDAFAAKVRSIESANANKKARRRAKRIKLGLPVPADDDLIQVTDESDHDDNANEEASAAVKNARREKLKRLAEKKRRKRGDSSEDDVLSEDSLFGEIGRDESPKMASRRVLSTIAKAKYPAFTKPSSEMPHPHPVKRGPGRPTKNTVLGVAGAGPNRFGKKRVQGAAVMRNWNAAPKKRRRTMSTQDEPRMYKNLSITRKAELRGRREPTPNPDNLVLFNPRDGVTVKPLAAPKQPAMSPWQMIQAQVKAKEAEEINEAQQGAVQAPSLVSAPTRGQEPGRRKIHFQTPSQVQRKDNSRTPSVSAGSPSDTPMLDADTSEIQQAVTPSLASATKPFHASSNPTGSQSTPSSTFSRSLPKQPRHPLPQGAPASHIDSEPQSRKSSLGPEQPVVIGNLSKATNQQAEEHVFPENAVFAKIRIGFESTNIGYFQVTGLDEGSRLEWIRQLGPEADLWFKHSCTADDYKEYLNDSLNYSYGDLQPVGRKAADALEPFIQAMKDHVCGGLYFFRDEVLILIYPVNQHVWNFIDSDRPVSKSVQLRLLLRSPLPSPTLNPEDLSRLVPNPPDPKVPKIEAIWNRIFEIKFRDLLPSQLKKKGHSEREAFLIFPTQHEHELAIILPWLECHSVKVYTSQTWGAWDYFSSYTSCGVILIHPSFYQYYHIPNLVATLKKNVNVFSFGAARDHPGTNGFSCTRLFPHGGAILLTDEVYLNQPKAANQIVQWFVRHKSRVVSWKLVGRPQLREWLHRVIDEEGPGNG